MKPTLLLIIINSFFLLACGNETETEEQQTLRPVRVMQVLADGNLNGRQFPAVIDAAKRANLSFNVAGRLKQFSVTESQSVKKGEVLARLDTTDIKISQQEAQVSYEQAKADFDRASQLVAQGHLSRSDFDQVKSTYSTAKLQLASANQKLSYTQIKAPFDGVVVKRFVEAHEDVTAKEDIVELQDLSELLVKVNVSEKLMMRSRANKTDRKYFVQFDGFKDKVFPVTFKEAVTRADEASQTYEVVFSMQKQAGYLILPGMTATLTIKQKNALQDIIILPANVVLSDNQGQYVFVVIDESSGVGKVQRKNVTVGKLRDNGIVIKAGLDSGSKVITAGMSRLTENMLVKIPVVNSK